MTKTHKQAEERLRRLAAFNEAALNSLGEGVYTIDTQGLVTFMNPAAEELFGWSFGELRGKKMHDMTHHHYRDGRPFPSCECAGFQVLTHGRPLKNHEDVFIRKDGTFFDVIYSITPMSYDGGQITGLIVVFSDITERKRAEAALRESEERLRAIVDTAIDAIIVIDEAGIMQSANPATERIFGYAPEEILGKNVSILMPEPYRSAHDGYINAYLRTGDAKIIGRGREVTGRRKDGKLFPADLAVVEWRLHGKRYFSGIIRDVSERKKREAQVQFLLREVNHRSKNMLAVVQAIAMRMAASDRDGFINGFSERLQVLAANQDLLVKSQWQGVKLAELVRVQLAHFEELIGSRIEISGPPLHIAAEAAQPIAMAVHELATNASKYGALGSGGGKVSIAWDAGDDGTFNLSWTESAGPAVVPPTRRGFGTTVIVQAPEAQLDAEVELKFPPGGVTWLLSCPAERVLEPVGPSIYGHVPAQPGSRE